MGDVFGGPGRRAVETRLRDLREELDVHVCIVNGENAADGRGLTPRLAERMLARGRRRDHARQPRLAPARARAVPGRDRSGRPARELSSRAPGAAVAVVPALDGTRVAV